MTKDGFIRILFEKTFDIPEVKKEIDKTFNDENFQEFFDKNSIIFDNNYVSPWKVTTFLLQVAIKLSAKRIPNDIIKNIYNVEAIKFAIIIHSTAILNNVSFAKKLQNVFINVLNNSKHYSTFHKSSNVKFSRTKETLPDFPLEFFWLLPILSNPAVLLKMDMENFIEQNIELSKTIGASYIQNYANFANQVTNFNTEGFKAFLKESMIVPKS